MARDSSMRQHQFIWLGGLAVHLPRPDPASLGLPAGRLPILKTRFKGTWLAAASSASLTLSLDTMRVGLRIQLLRGHGTLHSEATQHASRPGSHAVQLLDIDLLDGTYCVRVLGGSGAQGERPASAAASPPGAAGNPAVPAQACAHASQLVQGQHCPCVLLVAPCTKQGAGSQDGARMAVPGSQLSLQRTHGSTLVMKQPVIAFRFQSDVDGAACKQALQQAQAMASDGATAAPLLANTQQQAATGMRASGHGAPPGVAVRAGSAGMPAGVTASGYTPGALPVGPTPTMVGTAAAATGVRGVGVDQAAQHQLQEEEARMRQLIMRYIQEPGFMQYVDQLERVWVEMEEGAEGPGTKGVPLPLP